MLRASSGKHARLVGVCLAGGDSVPRRGGAADLFADGGFSIGKTCFNLPQHSSESMVFYRDFVLQPPQKCQFSGVFVRRFDFQMQRFQFEKKESSKRIREKMNGFWGLKHNFSNKTKPSR